MNNTNDIFNQEFSRRYDEYNDPLNAVSNNLRFLISVLLRYLPLNARILCVGVGTGTEIISLARQHPEWSFTGIDPSPDMLAAWAGMHSVASNSECDSEGIRSQMIERLLLLPPAQTEKLISEAGFSSVQQFFQSLLIHGWVAGKPVSGSPAP